MAKNQHTSSAASLRAQSDNENEPLSFASPEGSRPQNFISLLLDHFAFARHFSTTRGQRQRSLWERYAAIALIGVAIFFGFATYAAMAEILPFENSSRTVVWLLNIDLVILLLLLFLTANRIIAIWNNRKKGVAGSQLQTRLILIFSLLAAVPAVIMTVFSAYFFHYGIQTWFSERVSTAVTESQAVAEAYLEEHQNVIRADIMAMARDLDRNADKLQINPQGFERYMKTQIQFRNFSEAIVFTRDQDIYARVGQTEGSFNLISDEALDQADAGQVVLMTAPNEDRVRALSELQNFPDSYLYVARPADPMVLSRVNKTRQAAALYSDLEGKYSNLQIKTLMIFIVVALVLLLSAIWAGLVLAWQMSTPVTALINASERVRRGDLTVRVPEFESLDELDYLSRAFNRMTAQIATQRDELMAANRQLDHRRRFIETILAGVSVGIIGVDNRGKVTIANNPAADLFCDEKKAEGRSLVGKDIGDIVPGLNELLSKAHETPNKIGQFELPYVGSTGSKQNLLVRIAFELIGDEEVRAVMTFDDITELQSAQRKAAWSDVARRIAHEIKNPLTPIQLAAERLKRRYLQEIQNKPEVFEQCVETIIRQVDDIGRMVNEFSAFARMPEPVMKREKIQTLIDEVIFLHQEEDAAVEIRHESQRRISDENLVVLCDSQQIRQALTNILQNAIDSVKERPPDSSDQHGKIIIRTTHQGNKLSIAINDNGPGLPPELERECLTEPYVTFKEKGTGLGLAIVKKIMEDHKGRLLIGEQERYDNQLGGALIILELPMEALETSPQHAERDAVA